MKAKPCDIKYVGKRRNGKPRYWCLTHYARAQSDVPGILCERSSYIEPSSKETLRLVLNEYPAGIGLWGVLPPFFDSAIEKAPLSGIHVHARKRADSIKDIDGTYREVQIISDRISDNNHTFIISEEAATAYSIANLASRRIISLSCNKCGRSHVDAGDFAVTLHKHHLCTFCGLSFNSYDSAICNPLIELKDQLGDLAQERQRTQPNKVLECSTSDFPGGLQLWCTQPAILWTLGRLEELGIHVHGKDIMGNNLVDDSFDQVIIDGFFLDPIQIKQYILQLSIPSVVNRIISIVCPACNSPHEEREEEVFIPHAIHHCRECSTTFRTKRKVVGNPILDTLNQLKCSRPGELGKV